jgi:hypothetical protein
LNTVFAASVTVSCPRSISWTSCNLKDIE